MSNEIWKPVVLKGQETGWLVSNNGNFINTKGNLVRTYLRGSGYLFLQIKGINIDVHRVVAMHFCEQREGCNTVDHLDNDKLNNNADNLEWVTMSENVKRAMKNRKKRKTPSLYPKDVLKIIELKKQGMSNNKIALEIGCESRLVSAVVNGKLYKKISGIGMEFGEDNLTKFIKD